MDSNHNLGLSIFYKVDHLIFLTFFEAKKKKKMANVLEEERKKASFETDKLTFWLFGEKKTKRKREIRKIVAEDAIFRKDKIFLSNEEKHTRAMEKFVRMVEVRKQHNLGMEDAQLLANEIETNIPTSLHFSMFLPTLIK